MKPKPVLATYPFAFAWLASYRLRLHLNLNKQLQLTFTTSLSSDWAGLEKHFNNPICLVTFGQRQ